jgi:hypothetical protein
MPARAAGEFSATSEATTPAVRSSHNAPSSTSSEVARWAMLAMPIVSSSSAVTIGRIERGQSRQLGGEANERPGEEGSNIDASANAAN